MGYSPPGSSVHGILQARILGWVAISFSRGLSWPRIQTRVSHTAGRFFTFWATREAPVCIAHMYKYAWALYTWASFCVPMWPFVNRGKWHRCLCGYAHVHFLIVFLYIRGCVCQLCLVFWSRMIVRGYECGLTVTMGRRPDSGSRSLLLQAPRQLRITEWLLPGSLLGPLKKPCPSKGTWSQEFSLFCSTKITGDPHCLYNYLLGCPLPCSRLGGGNFL